MIAVPSVFLLLFLSYAFLINVLLAMSSFTLKAYVDISLRRFSPESDSVISGEHNRGRINLGIEISKSVWFAVHGTKSTLAINIR